jgi:hypothetical protein
MDFDYEDNVEIISEITNNLEQSVSIIFLFDEAVMIKKILLRKYYLFSSAVTSSRSGKQ